jgi:hypothetical protein
VRPARKADNLTAMCEPIVWKVWESRVSRPYVPPRPVTGIALPYLYGEMLLTQSSAS